MKFNDVGDLALLLFSAAVLESERGVRNVADRIVDCIGPDNRTIDYEQLRKEREQRILRGY